VLTGQMAEPLAPQFTHIDFGVLAELDDNEAALELVQMYDEESKSTLKQLEQLKEPGPGQTQPAWTSIWALLHKLKGSSLSIGLSGVAEFIESLRSSDASKVGDWYPKVVEQLKFAIDSSIEKIMTSLNS
jgi:HPt (histidine-containing phosphotransfer) domain-containing protein